MDTLTLDLYHHAAAYSAHNTAEAVTAALANLPFDPLNTTLSLQSSLPLAHQPLPPYDFDSVLGGTAADLFDAAPLAAQTPKPRTAPAPVAAAAAPKLFSPLRGSGSTAALPPLPVLPALPPLMLPGAALTAAATHDAVVGSAPLPPLLPVAPAGMGLALPMALPPGALVGLGPYAALFAAPPTDASEMSSSALSQLPLLPPAALKSESSSPASPDDSSPPHSPDVLPRTGANASTAKANAKANTNGGARSGVHTPPPPPLSPQPPAAAALVTGKPAVAPAAAAATAAAPKAGAAGALAFAPASALASRTASLTPHPPTRGASPPSAAKSAAEKEKANGSASASASASAPASASACDDKRESESGSPVQSGAGDSDDLRRKRLDRKAELARKNRMDKKRKLGDLEKTVAELKQQLDEARQLNGALSTALSAAQANAPAAEAKALSAQWLDEGSAARAVVQALASAASADRDATAPATKRARSEDGAVVTATGAAADPLAPSSADKAVAGSVEQLLSVWAHNNTATQHALRTLEQATASATSGLTAQFVQWLMAADNSAALGPVPPLTTTAGATGAAVVAQSTERRVSAVWQRVFVREVGVTPSQLSSLLALQSALTTTASADAFAASLVEGPPVVPGTGPAADDVGRAYTRLALGLARRARAATVALQAMQNVLSSEQMAKLVRCAIALSNTPAAAVAAAVAAPAAAAAAAAAL